MRRGVARGRARAFPPPPPLLPPEEQALFFFSCFFLCAGIDEELCSLREDYALEGHGLPRGAWRGGGPEGEAPRRRRPPSSCSSSLETSAAAPSAQRQRVEALSAVGSARRGLWRGEGDLRGGQARGGEDGEALGGGGSG